jgi:hypothetical protein
MTGRVFAVAAGTLTLLIAASGAQAGPPAGSTLEERRYYEARALLDRAAANVTRDSDCEARPGHRASGLADEPSAKLLRSLAALRRPAQPGELESADGFVPGLVAAAYRDYIRVAHAADGTAFTIVPLKNVVPFAPRPKHCVSDLRRRFGRAIAGRRAAFQRVARELLQREIAQIWLARPREGFHFLFGGGGVTHDLAGLRKRGIYSGQGGPEASQTTFYGLLPDGVASIDYTFRRADLPGSPSDGHPVTHRTTVAVRDNVVAFQVPVGLQDAWMSRQVWRGSDGRVIRVVPGR